MNIVDFPEELLQKMHITKLTGESAWTQEDVCKVLSLFQKRQSVVLGGDVLTAEERYTYDNWYYNPLPTDTWEISSLRSIEKARAYIESYTKNNGKDFLFVLVVRDRELSGNAELAEDSAWTVEDAYKVLILHQKRNGIVMGGDVLTVDGKYTADNWSYEPHPTDTWEISSLRSVEKAREYIESYTKKNGTGFLFSFFVRNKMR